MKGARRILLVAMVGLILAVGSVWAEVGVIIDLNDGPVPRGPYNLAEIVDDPDPIGSPWRAYGSSEVRKVLNPQGEANGDGRPSLLAHPVSGLPVVAWALKTPSGFDVVVSQFADGSWADPVVVASSPDDDVDPFLTVDRASGDVHVVYWVDGATPTVMHSVAPADLSSWSVPTPISLPGEVAVRPSAAIRDGKLQVAYESHVSGYGSTPRQIVLARQETVGFSYDVLATTQHAGSNLPQVHATVAGKLWVDWIDATGEMTWTEMQPGGGWGPIDSTPFLDEEERDFHVRGLIRSQVTDP